MGEIYSILAAIAVTAKGQESCCSYNYKDCGGGDWCNSSSDNCGTCGGAWINRQAGNCIALHGDCTSDGSTCCVSLECVGNQWYKQCQLSAQPGPQPEPDPEPEPNPEPAPAPEPEPEPEPAPQPSPDPAPGIVGELTMWTADPNAIQASSCEYAQPASTSGGNPQWLVPYVNSKKYCAVSSDLFENGAGCGKCFRIVYDGVGGTDSGQAGSEIIQVVDSGAGGQKHFDCSVDTFSTITGTDTGVFPVSYEEVDCENPSPLTVVVLDGPNAGYVKVLVAGGKTGVSAVTLTLDGTKQYNMYRGGGATWATSLEGLTNVSVRFDVTYADGSTGFVDGCYDGSWPVAIGSQCSGSRRLLRGRSSS